ncbi:unnamed protein product [Mortierella alpina]
MDNTNPDPASPPPTASLLTSTHAADRAALRTRQDVSRMCNVPSRDEQANQRLDPPVNTALNSQQSSSSGHIDSSGTLFAWQRLPQEALNQIAYNSRRQRNARLKASPPVCAYCPTKRFTSMAMLSTHCRSKLHLSRVQKQKGTPATTMAHADPVEPLPTLHDMAMEHSDDVERSPINALTARPSKGTDANAERAASPCSQHGTAVKNTVAGQSGLIGQPTAKQRKRRMERDRKRIRARVDLLSKNTSLLHAKVKDLPGETIVNGGHLDDIATQQYDPLHGRTTDSRPVESDVTPPVEGEATDLVTAPSAATATDEDIAQHQRKHWNCTVCKTAWKRKKAWQGHLLSAQHMRHLLRAMHEITPQIRPTRRLDVIASVDPLGWGTGVGVVEEEEEEEGEEEERGEQDGDVIKSELLIRHGQTRITALRKDGRNTSDNDGYENDDDMDLGE